MEAAIVTVIVGVGIMGTLELVAAGTVANADSSRLTTAMYLAGHVREMAVDVAFKENLATGTWGPEPGETSAALFDDIDDFDGQTFSPPLSGRRVPLDGYANWSQAIEVYSVDEFLVANASGKDNVNRPMSRVVVRVSHAGELIYETNWLVANTKR
jgi:hypothetical protein